MKKNKETFIGDKYFSDDLLIYLNRPEEGFERPHHFHNFIEINIVEEGRGYHFVNEEVIEVQKGELFLLPMGVSHVFRPASSSSKDKLIVCNIIFDIQILKQLINTAVSHGEIAFSKWCSRLTDNGTVDYLHFRDSYDTCLSLFRSMFLEFQEKQSGYSIILHAKLRELLIKLFRLEYRFIPNSSSKISSFAINEAISYMHQNLHEPISLSHIANLMSLSESHFVRIFKKYTNQTFIEYLQNMRIEKSCHLLLHTDLSIKEISNLVGYTNVDYFRTLFGKKIGTSPKEYRKHN